MATSKIDFSADFGGRDAASVALPHFRALKSAATGLHPYGFPFETLAFILRVDGDVHQYGFTGAGTIDIDTAEKYLSVDIGIQLDDQNNLFSIVSDAIGSSPEMIAASLRSRSCTVDLQELEDCLSKLCSRYSAELCRQAK